MHHNESSVLFLDTSSRVRFWEVVCVVFDILEQDSGGGLGVVR